jgi:nitrate reductase (NAD(P)H)
MKPNAPNFVDSDGNDNHDAIYACIPGIESIQAEVFMMMKSYGYYTDELSMGLDPRDANNTDSWVPRNPRMNRLTGIHPFNSEAPLSLLRDHGFITPPRLHIVRNHGKVPKLSWADHVIEIDGLVDRPIKLTMAELVKLPLHTCPITVQCAGNRRKEQNLIKKGMGFDWGTSAVSTNIWTGVLMRDVLNYVGIKSVDEGARWVDFFGPSGEVPNGDTIYGASHHRHVMMDPTRPVMLAFLQNGELLHPDHGYPVRLLIPGYIGGRMIKWLCKISVSPKETENFYHVYDNRVFPPHILSKDIATKEAIWTDPAYRIDDRNLMCVLWKPGHSTKLMVSDRTTELSGYAYNGAGRPVHRVEVTLNGGKHWRMADIKRFEPTNESGKQWCWVFWSCEVPISALANCAEICVRAWDDCQNVMTALPTWNLMGMMNNPWFRVKVSKVAGNDNEIWFEHPTRVEPTPGTFYPNGEYMHLVNGEVASPGWAERLHKDYSAAYAPKEKTDETPDANGGWEQEVAHRLGAQIIKDAPEEKEEEVVQLDSAGRPIALVAGKKIKLKLAERTQLSRTVVLYSFALPSPEHVLGLPVGQHVHISTKMANPRTGGELKPVSRAYTPISTNTHLGKVDLVIKTYYKDEHPRFPDGGWLSQYMDAMKVGDELDFKGPTGKIVYEGDGVFIIRGEKRKYKKIGCISGGTGVTPCFQLMQHVDLYKEPLDISLLYANQTPDEILLKDRLDELNSRGQRVAYTVDRVPDDTVWGGYVGFISADMVQTVMPPPGEGTLILACGPPIMVDKCVRPICEKLGYTLECF